MTDASLSPEQFAVGEIAILAYSRFGRIDGPVECVVVGPLALRLNTTTQLPERGYAVEVDGREYSALPEQLRKKRPPAKDRDVVRWADCPWQPESLHV